MLGTNCVDNGPRQGLDKFLQAASSSPDTVLHYEFMQVHHCPLSTVCPMSALGNSASPTTTWKQTRKGLSILMPTPVLANYLPGDSALPHHVYPSSVPSVYSFSTVFLHVYYQHESAAAMPEVAALQWDPKVFLNVLTALVVLTSVCLWLQDYRVHIKHTDGHFEHVPYFSLPANDLTDVIAPSCYSCFDYPNALADLVSLCVDTPAMSSLH